MWTKQDMPDQTGKIVIITGANSGIGFQTALAMYEAGARVIVACRTEANAQMAIEQIKTSSGTGALEAALIDLSSLDSVRSFATTFLVGNTKLDLLINNAGVMIPPASLTADNFELQFGVNFLGHFALTGLLYSLLRDTPASRVVTLTSLAYTIGSIDFDNFRLNKEYNASREYNQSKLANLLFTFALQQRIEAAGHGVLSLAAHPGVTRTNLARNMSADLFNHAIQTYGELKPASQGALASLFAAVSPDIQPGGFYGPDEDGGLRGYPAKTKIQPVGLDQSTADRLWDFAEAATKVVFP